MNRKLSEIIDELEKQTTILTGMAVMAHDPHYLMEIVANVDALITELRAQS